MLEFTSEPAEGEEREPDHEVKFKLDGVEFACVLRNDADSILGWSELAGAASEDTDVESAEGAAFVSRFFRHVMDEAEYRRFRGHLKRHHAKPEVLVEVMNAIDAEMRNLTEGDSGRPTVAPSSSSGGRPETVPRSAQIALLQGEDGEVAFAPRPNREARRRAERDQRRAFERSAAAG